MEQQGTPAVHKPTEAQLRWAQFRHKRHAVHVRERVAQLLQTPASPKDVPEALSDDGVASTCSISKGRRALLLVSQRKFQERKRRIEEHGFRNRLREDDEVLDQIFGTHRDRFEAALESLMERLAQTPAPEIEHPTRIWTRTEKPTQHTIDGKNYLDLKWGVLQRETPLRPQRLYESGTFVSPVVQQKFSSLVEQMQQAPVEELSKKFDEKKDDFVIDPGVVRELEQVEPGWSDFVLKELSHEPEDWSSYLEGSLIRFRQTRTVEHMVDRIEQAGSQERFAELLQSYLDATAVPKLWKESRAYIGEDGAVDRVGLMGVVDKYLRSTTPKTPALFAPAEASMERTPIYQQLRVSPQKVQSIVRDIEEATHAEQAGQRRTKFQQLVQIFLGSPRNRIRPDDSWTRCIDENGNVNTEELTDLVESYLGSSPVAIESPVSNQGGDEYGVGDRSILNDMEELEPGFTQYLTNRAEEIPFDGDLEDYLVGALREYRSTLDINPEGSLVRRLVDRLEVMGSSLSSENEIARFEGLLSELLAVEAESGPEGEADAVVERYQNADQEMAPTHLFRESVAALVERTDAGQVTLDSLRLIVEQYLCDTFGATRRSLQTVSEVEDLIGVLPLSHERTASKDPEPVVEPEQYHDDTRSSYGDVVRRISLAVEEDLVGKELFSEDGELDAALIEALVEQHLSEYAQSAVDECVWNVKSPVALAHARRTAGKNDDTNPETPSQTNLSQSVLGSCAKRIVQDIERSIDFRGVFTAEGSFVTERFEALVSSHLRESLHVPTNTDEKHSPCDSDFFAELRRGPSVTSGIEMSSVQFKGDFEGSSSEDKHTERGPGEEELRAVAAFRRMQGERGRGEDASSLSSFRILPDDIREVVKEVGRRSMDTSRHAGDAGIVGSEELQQDDDEAGPGLLSSMNSIMFRRRVLERTTHLADDELDPSVIDTDGSDISQGVSRQSHARAANLLLSPTLLTRRLKQAISATENRNWDQLTYLLTANPWLAEMPDLATKQYLLHKVALYGSGVGSGRTRSAPLQLSSDVVRMFPSSVHKFDENGNLPIHMAAASGNLPMISLLGDRFPSGASVRNEYGQLPLHLAIHACGVLGSRQDVELVSAVLRYFPGAIAISDGDGNLPLHVAVSTTQNVAVISLLYDEAERQAADPDGVRFRNVHGKSGVVVSDAILDDQELARDDDYADEVPCNLIKNAVGHNPLSMAIRARAGWSVIQTIVSARGGMDATLQLDQDGNNALHLLVGNDYGDPVAAVSLLEVFPVTAAHRNTRGILPIECACINMLPREVVLALVLVDLPTEMKPEALRTGSSGDSWWYINCDCDDHYWDIVDEVLAMCSYSQVRELCFVKDASGHPLLSRASPKCRQLLQRALRLVGRFEFTGSAPTSPYGSAGVKVFDALDYGSRTCPYPTGRRVQLRCYSDRELFATETETIRGFHPDISLVQDFLIFAIGEDGAQDPKAGAQQYCIAVELADLTLRGVLSGFLSNPECRTDKSIRDRYTAKILAVLRIICRALFHVHSEGLVHGSVGLDACGKFGDKWKLSCVLGLLRVGRHALPSTPLSCLPPEALRLDKSDSKAHRVTRKEQYVADPSMDVWAFGRLAYEVLVGEQLIGDTQFQPEESDRYHLMDVLHWSEFSCDERRSKIRDAGVLESAEDLIVSCLSPAPSERPSFEDVLSHAIWKSVKR